MSKIVYIKIGDEEYILVDSSVDHYVVIGEEVDIYDTVKIKFGKKSKFIFDIQTV